MKKNAMRRNLRQSIKKSIGRYIAIAAIIGLGAGLFMGLRISKTDMVATGQVFMDEQNMFDLRLISNYGWTEEYVEEAAELEGVVDAEGVFYIDLIAQTTQAPDDAVYRFYTLPERVNRVALRGGRMPQSDDECLADGFFGDDSVLGTRVEISQTNDEDSLDIVQTKTFTVVGYVATPIYMDMNRGTTSVGSGSLTNYFYVPAGALDAEYYTEINVTLDGEYLDYTDKYNNFLEDTIDRLEPQMEEMSERRFQELRNEIEEEYNEGYQEYLDGKEEYEEAKAEADQELGDAYQELKDSEKELEENEEKLRDAGKQIDAGYKQIEEARIKLYENQSTLFGQMTQLNDGIAQAQAGVSQAEAGIYAATGHTVSELQASLEMAQALLNDPNATEEQKIAANATIAGVNQALGPYYEVTGVVSDLQGKKTQLENGLLTIEATLKQLEQQETALGHAYDKLMINWGLWGEGRDELAEGWIEYEDAKAEAEQELADAEAELKDAEEELADAREEIDSMDEPDLIVLDRNSNVGYNNLDSSSSIVEGVSRIIPVFFLLVASLVCITTMTRMIDEERTQIGTLKALGYTNSEIMKKYLVYSGSSAVIGCTIGIFLGCTVVPMIIWEAYCIMLYIQPDVLLQIDWPLSIAIVVVYTAVMLLVTWYSCRRTLEEEPAELIRPKAPDPGKKLLIEKLSFWHKVSFLNKVTIRNIFRYRQRLAMMLIGIGGCTALLLTGFGLRDTIVNIVDYQFEDVTLYDMSVYFRDEIHGEQMEEFASTVQEKVEQMMYYHQSSVELDYRNRVKELYMISAGEELTDFINLHKGERQLSLPEKDEVVLSVGVAENMGIDVGETVVLRNADMQELELTVSAIYDNYVENFSIVAPETIESHWGSAPELQMAFVKMAEGEQVHNLGAAITDLDFVMNVSVSQDQAEMVSGMMEALDLVVLLIVFCAGLLAVTVLYNLTNININERIREIATIKVLGFNASETAAYVFKENLTLTVVGSGLGLLLGRLLLAFVISQIKIDMVWFRAMTAPMSYVWAISLTLLSAIVVDFIFYFKLDKINMAEALKSVE